jgi:hypothetical protein
VVATALRRLSQVLNARSTTRSTSGGSPQPYGFIGNGSPNGRLHCSTTEGKRPRYATHGEIPRDKLKSEEAKIRERLATMEEEYDLAVELHAPSGAVIRIGAIAYFPDSNDALRVQGIDVRTREAC